MAAVASMSSTISGNSPAASGPDEESLPSTGARVKTLSDIRNITTVVDRDLATFAPASAEQIQELKLARKEVLEFYSSLTEDGKKAFLKSANLENVDPELWLELLEPHLENLFDEMSLITRFGECLIDKGPHQLSRVCREVIASSDLPIKAKLEFLAIDDFSLRLLLLRSCAANGDVMGQQQVKQHIYDYWDGGREAALWLREGVISPQELGNEVIEVQTLLHLSPSAIAKVPIQHFSINDIGNMRNWPTSDLKNIQEKLSLIGEHIPKSSEAKAKINQAIAEAGLAKWPIPIDPETEAAWRKACSISGISTCLTLNNLASRELFGSFMGYHHGLPSFLSWYNAQPEETRHLRSWQIVSKYEAENKVFAGKECRVLATILSQDSIISKHAALRGDWETKPIIQILFRYDIPIPAPEDVKGFAEIFQHHHLSIRPWVNKYQDELLVLLQSSLADFKSDPGNRANEDLLMDIHAGVLFLKAYKPKECGEMLSQIIGIEEYAHFTKRNSVHHQTAVRVAYERVTSIPKDALPIKDETQLFDSSKLYWTVPAGNRWIFMEGLEAPKHEVLFHACALLRDITDNQLRVNCSERSPKTKSLKIKIAAARERLIDIDPVSLSETELIFHASLLPLFSNLTLWSNGEKPDIQMIVDVEDSGLARPADPTDTVKITAGNHFDFLQKIHRERENSFLSRECPVLDQDRFKRNLLMMAKISAEVLAKKSGQGEWSDTRAAIPPGIPELRTNPAVLFKLSDPLAGDARYLTTALFSRMAFDYSYVPVLAGPLSDFVATTTKDQSSQKVSLSIGLAGNGTIIPCPHHGFVNSESVHSILENISIAHHPDGVRYIQGGAGFAQLAVPLELPREAHEIEIDRSMTYDEARSSLPVDIYNQLTIPIATLEELPASLQEAICAARSMPVAEAADFIEHFVRSNYVYSFEAANSHVYQGFQKDRAAEVVHEENAYLKMIHALGDDKCLGKGVCGQLSTVLFASLRLAGVPCFMTSGYLAAEQEIDENMGHAYVSAVLRTTDGRWRFKILEATGGGVEGLIALQKRELQRLQSIQKSGPHEETALEQSARRHMESNKWSWLVAEFGDSIANLTDHDADIFYVQVMSCRGLEPNPDPSAADVADAYGALIGSSEDLVSRLDPVFIQYPRIQRIFEIAKERRTEIIKKIEAQLFDDFEVGGADTTLPRL